MENRYFWLRLKDDFFRSKRIKKLRKLAGGDTYTIIYLKMQLLSIKTGGIIRYAGIEPTIAEEIALDIDEATEDVEVTLNYLLKVGLMETSDSINFMLPYAIENTGSEGSSAKRVREYRERQKVLQSNADVTAVKQNCYGEIEQEQEIEKDIDIVHCTEAAVPTIDEVGSFAKVNGIPAEISERFFYHYNKSGWMTNNGQPVQNWKGLLMSWMKASSGKSDELDPIIAQVVQNTARS